LGLNSLIEKKGFMLTKLGNNHIVTSTHLAKAREFIAIPSSYYSTLATCHLFKK
jgi:hypothetical protein